MLARNTINNVNTAKKRAWFFWAGLISIVFSTTLLMIMFALGQTEAFIFSEWYQFLIPIPAFFGGHLSGWTSLGREVDLVVDDEKKWTSEQWASLAGIVLGLVVGVGLVVARSTIQLATAGISDVVITTLSAAASVIGSIGGLSGLTSRIESTILRPKLESYGGFRGCLSQLASVVNKKRKSVLAGIILGLGTSLALWFTGTAALTVVVGVTSFFTGGAAIPLWIACGIFCLTYTATNASSFDYINKMQTFYQAAFLKDNESEKIIEGKFHEYRGSAIGVTIGFVVATALVITLLVTQPYLVALVGAIAVTLVCTNTFGSLCSYLGSLMDIGKAKYKNQTSTESLTIKTSKPTSTMSSEMVKISLINLPAKQRYLSPQSIGKSESSNADRDKQSVKALIYKTRPRTPKIDFLDDFSPKSTSSLSV